jgi:hypothetical protein
MQTVKEINVLRYSACISPVFTGNTHCKRPDNRTFAGRFDRGMIVPEVTEMLRVQPDL